MKRERGSARAWTEEYYRSKQPAEPDVLIAFVRAIDELASPGIHIVDVGCGDDFILSRLPLERVRITGVDATDREHPYDALFTADLDRAIPLDDASVDLAVSKFVFEHLARPERAVSELARIVKPGGSVLILTPDIRYPPYAINYLLSRYLAQTTRMRLVSRFTGRDSDDIYPVYYRCNTPRRLTNVFRAQGFGTLAVNTYSDYRIVSGWKVLGFLATWYELALNHVGLRGPRGFILAAFEKDM